MRALAFILLRCAVILACAAGLAIAAIALGPAVWRPATSLDREFGQLGAAVLTGGGLGALLGVLLAYRLGGRHFGSIDRVLQTLAALALPLLVVLGLLMEA